MPWWTMTTAIASTSRVAEFRTRVRLGNDRTVDAWRQAVVGQLTDQQWVVAMGKIDDAMTRLDALCQELLAAGYRGCLYDTRPCGDTRDLTCFVCPSAIPYWNYSKMAELVKVPAPDGVCPICLHGTWWWRPASDLGGPGGWCCRRCSPDPRETS